MASIREIHGKDNAISYNITVSLGRDANNKQIRKSMTFIPTTHKGMSSTALTKQVNDAAAEFERSVRANGKYNCDSTFKDFADYVMSIKKDTYKTRTYETNISRLERINKVIGEKKLRTITAHDLNVFYASLRQMGENKRNGGRLSEKTVVEYHRLVRLVLQHAVKESVLTVNVANQAESPRVKRKAQVNYYQEDKLKNILACAKLCSLRNRLIINLLATTGCRKGELAGFNFRDINCTTGEISINKAVLYTKKRGIYIEDVKGYENRTNTLPPEVVELVKQYKEWYMEYKSKFVDWKSADDIEDCFLFIKQDGNVMHPDSVQGILRRFAHKYNLDKVNAHAFRHTYASLLILKGVDMVTVSKLMGHASVTTTMKFYSHLMNDSGKVSQSLMGALLDEIA